MGFSSFAASSGSKHARLMGQLVLIFFTGLGILYFTGLGWSGLFDVDEAIFTQASVEMLKQEDFITPSYNGEPRYHKPPLIYWLQSLSMHLTDIGPFGARLPSAILAFLTVLFFFNETRLLTGSSRYSLMAATILALNLSFLVLGRAAVADMAFIFFSLTGTFLLVNNIFAKERKTLPQIVAGFMFAAALLAKGPVGVMIPLIVLPLAIVHHPKHFKYHLKCANPLIILPMMFVALVPWMAMIYEAHGWAFFKEFFMVHNVARYADGFGNSHASGWHYYLVVLLVGFFPWVFFLPMAVSWVLANFKDLIRPGRPEDFLAVAGLIWFAVVLVFFSFSATKLPHYIVPALPGAALLLAGRFNALHDRPRMSPWHVYWMLPVIALFGGVFILLNWALAAFRGEGPLSPVLLSLSERFSFAWPAGDEMTQHLLSQNIGAGIVPVAIGAIIIIGMPISISYLLRGYRQGFFALALSTWMVLVLIAVGLVPTVYAYMQKPLADVAQMIKQKHADGFKRVYYVSLHQPSLRFLSGVRFIPLDGLDALQKAAGKQGKALFVADKEHVPVIENVLYGTPKKTCVPGYCVFEYKR